MGIDLRGLGVGTADEFVERAERDLAGGGQLGSEGVAEAVEANGPGAGVAAGDLEALGDLAAVKRVAGLWVGEDQVVVAVVDGAGRPVVDGGEEAVGHGDQAAGGEVGLAVGGVFAADPGVADADALG